MEKAIFLLKDLDFTESESKAYITLLQNGAITGYEVSKRSGVSRSKVYNVLESLREKGAVLVSKQSDPVLYTAVSVEELLARMRNVVAKKFEAVDSELSHFNANDVSDELWYIKGYENVMNRCRHLIKNAKESVLLEVWNDDIDEIVKELQIFENDNKHCAVVYYDNSHKYDLPLKNVYAHGFEANMLEENNGERWINLVIDDNELLFGHLKGYKDVEVIWTKHRPMVFLARENTRHNIYCLKLIDMLDDEGKASLGKGMLDIKDLFIKGE